MVINRELFEAKKRAAHIEGLKEADGIVLEYFKGLFNRYGDPLGLSSQNLDEVLDLIRARISFLEGKQ